MRVRTILKFVKILLVTKINQYDLSAETKSNILS